jgi:hypothetical protein
MLILPISCLFVLLRLAAWYESLEEQVGTGNLESQASCALDHFSLPNNVPVNHCDMLRLI